MDTCTEVKTHCSILGEMISSSFSGFNKTSNMDNLKKFVNGLRRKGYDVKLNTILNGGNKHSFKTAVINLEKYLGYSNDRIDYEFIYSYLGEEKNRAIEKGEHDSAAVITHVKKRIFEIEGKGSGKEEIVQLFEMLPPYKLMKYDVNCNGPKIIVTVITPFNAFINGLKDVFE